MGTTIAEDNAKFLSVITSMEVNAGAGAMGSLVYAGNLWPLGVANPNVIGATSTGRQMRREIDAAFVDARAMATAGFVKATAAIKGDEASGLLMKKWFGRRQTGVGDNDWWLGAQRILGNLQRQLLRDINVFYRGSDTLLGSPTDYPGQVGNLTGQDVNGYAETFGDAADGNIGLCKLFFRRESNGVFKTAQKGRDSIGGCLTHELSHNYCGTDDHDAYGGGTCYGDADCQRLAKKRRRRAWYNADNIEYFCEDAYFGIVASKASIDSGAESSIGNVRTAHLNVLEQLKPMTNQQRLLLGPKGATQVTGSVALLRAHIQAAAIAQDPTLSVDQVQVPSRNRTAELMAKFNHQ